VFKNSVLCGGGGKKKKKAGGGGGGGLWYNNTLLLSLYLAIFVSKAYDSWVTGTLVTYC